MATAPVTRRLFPGLARLVDEAGLMELERLHAEQDLGLTADQIARLEADADRWHRTQPDMDMRRFRLPAAFQARLVIYRSIGRLPAPPRTFVEKQDVLRAHCRRLFQLVVLEILRWR